MVGDQRGGVLGSAYGLSCGSNTQVACGRPRLTLRRWGVKMTDKHSKISLETDIVTANSSGASLTATTAATLASIHSGTGFVRTATMVRTQIHATMKMANTAAESNTLEQHQGALLLHNGQADPDDLDDALDNTLNLDFSPAAGTDLHAAVRAQQGVIQLIIPFKLKQLIHDEAGDVIRSWFEAEYIGPPLRQGGSWTYPEGQGWRLSVYNWGGTTWPSGVIINVLMRSHVIFSER